MAKQSGPYDILEVLADGPDGTVVAARVRADPLKRTVALRVLRGPVGPHLDGVKLQAATDHPNVVRVGGVKELDGRGVIVMELVRGMSLADLLLRFKHGLPATIALEVMRDICIALHEVSSRARSAGGGELRSVHRDLRSSKVMVSLDGQVKIDGLLGPAPLIEWKPHMAPEELDPPGGDAPADVYSAGVLSYELLTGRSLVSSVRPEVHDIALREHLQHLDVLGASSADRDALQALVGAMCAHDPAGRPSLETAARELEAIRAKLDPAYQMELVEFARVVLTPLHASVSRAVLEPGELEGAPQGGESGGSAPRSMAGATRAGGISADATATGGPPAGHIKVGAILAGTTLAIAAAVALWWLVVLVSG